MHPLPAVPELEALARRVVWFKAPADALICAPPGVVDDRSWACWNLNLLDRYPAPPLPTRDVGRG